MLGLASEIRSLAKCVQTLHKADLAADEGGFQAVEGLFSNKDRAGVNFILKNAFLQSPYWKKAYTAFSETSVATLTMMPAVSKALTDLDTEATPKLLPSLSEIAKVLVTWRESMRPGGTAKVEALLAHKLEELMVGTDVGRDVLSEVKSVAARASSMQVPMRLSKAGISNDRFQALVAEAEKKMLLLDAASTWEALAVALRPFTTATNIRDQAMWVALQTAVSAASRTGNVDPEQNFQDLNAPCLQNVCKSVASTIERSRDFKQAEKELDGSRELATLALGVSKELAKLCQDEDAKSAAEQACEVMQCHLQLVAAMRPLSVECGWRLCMEGGPEPRCEGPWAVEGCRASRSGHVGAKVESRRRPLCSQPPSKVLPNVFAVAPFLQ